jgi:uncharacterized protein YndB with AHSA1/START domain
MNQEITVETLVNARIEKIWEYWNTPTHITKWAFASDDWHSPKAENDLRAGGKFKTRMEAKDGSSSFDLTGTYTKVEEFKQIEYVMDKAEGETENRKVKTEFIKQPEGYKIVTTFDAENINPIEMQKGGWQTILDNFKKYTIAN